MYNFKKILLFSVLLYLIGACTKEEFQKDGDFFYLKNEAAIMPVWVKGNQVAKKFIILLHGGPEGGSSQYYSIFPAHKKIEEQFAIVYWDQRMCGMSQGNPSLEAATLEQFTEDLDQLIALLNEKYEQPVLYLMGHSWGGALGMNYLLKHPSKITAWIEIDGGHSWNTANALSRTEMMSHAQEQIDQEEEQDYWTFALNWYEEHPIVGINDNVHYTFVGKANGYDFDPSSDSLAIPFTDLLLFSPISTAYLFVPYQFPFLDEGLDLKERVPEIEIPTLLCWGKHDGVFPVSIAQDTYENLGTPEADKYLKIFERSAHSPNYEEPFSFANTVIEFVGQY